MYVFLAKKMFTRIMHELSLSFNIYAKLSLLEDSFIDKGRVCLTAECL